MASLDDQRYAGLGAPLGRGDLVPSPRFAASIWLSQRPRLLEALEGRPAAQFLDPLFYLVALGFGLGTYVAIGNGIPYKEFVAPGLIASATMWSAVVRDAPTTSTCG